MSACSLTQAPPASSRPGYGYDLPSLSYMMRDPDDSMPVCDGASQLRMGFPVGAVWWPLGELKASAQSPWKDHSHKGALVSLLRGPIRSESQGHVPAGQLGTSKPSWSPWRASGSVPDSGLFPSY